MLEQLQRLQAHLDVLKTRLAHVEQENASLEQQKQQSQEQHLAQISKKDALLLQKEDEIARLTQDLKESKDQFQHLNQDATALAERYGRLEKSCTDLKNRFQEILAERNELRIVKEKFTNQQRQNQQELQEMKQERERLIQKNELAKSKVEAIIERLANLGTAQDKNAQEIQQLANPSVESPEETQS